MTERDLGVMFSSGRDVQSTPNDLFRVLNERYKFVIDVAAEKSNRKVARYFGPDHEDPALRDCLTVSWPRAEEGACFMNPPYSVPEKPCQPQCKKKTCKKRGFHVDTYKPGCIDFVRKAAQEAAAGSRVVCLLAGRTDVNWFHSFVYWSDRFVYGATLRPGVELFFIRGRLKFNGSENSAPFPSIICVFNPIRLTRT
jgi:site-specific DNA-methyltransferase (adenine-specific)